MPDITMCTGEVAERVCPQRERCQRYTAKLEPLSQSFFSPMPAMLDGTCHYFMRLRDRDG